MNKVIVQWSIQFCIDLGSGFVYLPPEAIINCKVIIIVNVSLVSMSAANDTQNIRRGLSPTESFLLSSLSSKDQTIFKISDITKEMSCSYKSAKELVNTLQRKKWIVNINRGVYLIIPLTAGIKSEYTEHEFVIANYLASPSYISYWSALNYHGLTDQTPFTVFVVTTKRLRNRTVLDIKYKFITISNKKFFGYISMKIGIHSFNVSDLEKSLVDALDHPEYCGGISEVAKCLWNARGKISLTKIIDYSIKMQNKTILKRLGYLLEKLGFETKQKTLASIKDLISAGMSPLDPTVKTEGVYNTKWNLMINVTKDKLESWKTES